MDQGDPTKPEAASPEASASDNPLGNPMTRLQPQGTFSGLKVMPNADPCAVWARGEGPPPSDHAPQETTASERT
jgi:hypothetical protein